MRALIAAAIGAVAALALVFTLAALGSPTGSTSPKPLLTTVPEHQRAMIKTIGSFINSRMLAENRLKGEAKLKSQCVDARLIAPESKNPAWAGGVRLGVIGAR